MKKSEDRRKEYLSEIQKGGTQREQSQMAGMARPTQEPPIPAFAGTCFTSGASKNP